VLPVTSRIPRPGDLRGRQSVSRHPRLPEGAARHSCRGSLRGSRDPSNVYLPATMTGARFMPSIPFSKTTWACAGTRRRTVLRPQEVVRVPDLDENPGPGLQLSGTRTRPGFGKGNGMPTSSSTAVSVPDQAELGHQPPLQRGRRTSTALSRPTAIRRPPEYYSLLDGSRKSSPDSQLCPQQSGRFKVVVDAPGGGGPRPTQKS